MQEKLNIICKNYLFQAIVKEEIVSVWGLGFFFYYFLAVWRRSLTFSQLITFQIALT